MDAYRFGAAVFCAIHDRCRHASGVDLRSGRSEGTARVELAGGRWRSHAGAALLALLLLVHASAVMALSCTPPDRQPTDAEREQWTAFQDQRQRHRAALLEAVRSDPLLGPVLQQLETVGRVTLDPRRDSNDPPVIGSTADLGDAMTNELAALLLMQSTLDSGDAPQVARRLIAHWKDRGLPWTVLAAYPVDPDAPEDRQRVARQLRESLDLPLNTPLASQIRALGIRYFELEARYPEPAFPRSLQAAYVDCDMRPIIRRQLFEAALDVVNFSLREHLHCDFQQPDWVDACEAWLEKLDRESPLFWSKCQDWDDQRCDHFHDRYEACGPLQVLRAIQTHPADWRQAAALLRDCPSEQAAVESATTLR